MLYRNLLWHLESPCEVILIFFRYVTINRCRFFVVKQGIYARADMLLSSTGEITQKSYIRTYYSICVELFFSDKAVLILRLFDNSSNASITAVYNVNATWNSIQHQNVKMRTFPITMPHGRTSFNFDSWAKNNPVNSDGFVFVYKNSLKPLQWKFSGSSNSLWSVEMIGWIAFFFWGHPC